MKMSPDGRRRLTQREGRKLVAYKDTKGILTIGIGHTAAAGPPHPHQGMIITAEECDRIFMRDLVQYEDAVNAAVRVPLQQNQFDACVSFCFNIGTAGFARSTVVRRLNNGDYAGAADAFLLWNKPPEIMGRRRGERLQFLEPAGTVPPPPDIPKPIERPVKPRAKGIPETAGGTVVGGGGVVIAHESAKHGASAGQVVIVLLLTIAIVAAVVLTIRWWRKR